MGLYNTLTTSLACPRCGQASEMEVELFFGRRTLKAFLIGDLYEWLDGRAVRNGGRPMDGNLDGEGYAECPSCGKDFFVLVEVRSDEIRSAGPDPLKPPLIP